MPVNGRDVVLAMAFQPHVAQQDHVVVAGDVLEGAGELGGGILAIAAEPLLVGLDDALGGIGQGPSVPDRRPPRPAACARRPRPPRGRAWRVGGVFSLTPGLSFTGRLLRVTGCGAAPVPRGMCGAAGCPILSGAAAPMGRPAATDSWATHGRSERDLQLEAPGAGGAYPAFAAAFRPGCRPSRPIPSCAARR